MRRKENSAKDEPADPKQDRAAIAALAYSYWEARGGEGGSSEEDWLRAERELKAPRN